MYAGHPRFGTCPEIVLEQAPSRTGRADFATTSRSVTSHFSKSSGPKTRLVLGAVQEVFLRLWALHCRLADPRGLVPCVNEIVGYYSGMQVPQDVWHCLESDAVANQQDPPRFPAVLLIGQTQSVVPLALLDVVVASCPMADFFTTSSSATQNDDISCAAFTNTQNATRRSGRRTEVPGVVRRRMRPAVAAPARPSVPRKEA